MSNSSGSTKKPLVMTPQLQQALKILQLSLPELEAVVQSELDSNPMLEPLDHSVAEAAPEASAPVTWQEAVARLARERTAAETCAALLKKRGDETAIDRGALA
jgi:RNA polymerase sigma-54 factor